MKICKYKEKQKTSIQSRLWRKAEDQNVNIHNNKRQQRVGDREEREGTKDFNE